MKEIIGIIIILLLTTSVFLPVTESLDNGSQPDLLYAIIHYSRQDGDYGDHTTGDYNDYWGLHLWGDIYETTEWINPLAFLGEDEYGRFAWVKLTQDAANIGFIVHRGEEKDGTNADRFFNPQDNLEIWLKNDDANTYSSQAEAQEFVTIHYHRDDGDYGDPTSDNFYDYWGLHLWGDAIDPLEVSLWTLPKKPTGIDDYGIFWDVLINDAFQPVNFIVHRGDEKDPGPDQSFVPFQDSTIWLQSADETIYPQRGAAENFAIIHYHRDDGDYGDPTSSDFNDFWGLHVWTGALNPTPIWYDPERPDHFDIFGEVFKIDLVEGALDLAYILHRGDDKDPGPDQFLVFADYGYEVWQLNDADPEKPYILPVSMLGEINIPPTLTVDNVVVDVDEGFIASNNGAVIDYNGDNVILSVTLGTIINNNDDTWSWSFSTSDGPDDSTVVTIFADDDNGGTNDISFLLMVNNVAPTINYVNNNGPVLVDTNVIITVDASDPAGSSDPLNYFFDCDDDGMFEIGPLVTSSTICVFYVPGEFQITAMVIDDDGDSDTETTQVKIIDEFGALQDIDDYIQNLPDSVFRGNADKRKMTLHNMILAINDMLVDLEYNGAIEAFSNNIREKADGLIDGISNNDWIIDYDVQYHLCMKIDDLTAYLSLL